MGHKYWIEFFGNKEYSARFKLANFIMGDALRKYLEQGCLHNIAAVEKMDAKTTTEIYMKGYLIRVKNAIHEIMYRKVGY